MISRVVHCSFLVCVFTVVAIGMAGIAIPLSPRWMPLMLIPAAIFLTVVMVTIIRDK